MDELQQIARGLTACLCSFEVLQPLKWFVPALGCEEVTLDGRRYRTIKQVLPKAYARIADYDQTSSADKRHILQVGEGGYSFVYLVRELPSTQCPDPPPLLYALKKVRPPASADGCIRCFGEAPCN